MNEYLLSVDNYNKPTKVTGKKAEYYVILKLLLTKKGSNPLFPDMGVDLPRRYRYIQEDKLPVLEQDIYDQISTYLPELLINTVQLTLENKELKLKVSSSENKTNYIFEQDQFGLDGIIENSKI